MPDATTDIIVIGGGVIGLAAAFRLAGRGHRVMLLEKDRCGGGATGAALGALMPHAPTARTPLADIQFDSLAAMPDFVAEVEAVGGLDCGYRKTGRLEILNSEQAAARAVERVAAARTRWHGLGTLPLRWVDVATARSLVPWVAASPHGYLHDDATARIAPDRLVAGLRAACRARGVALVEGSPVRALRASARGVEAWTDGERMAAGHAVVCAGLGLPELAGAAPPVAIAPVKGQAMALPLAGASSDWPLVYGGGSFALFHDGDVHIGSTTEKSAAPELTVTREGLADLRGRCRMLLHLPQPPPTPRLWSGFRPATPDRQPVVGPHPRSARIILAGGHYKVGLGLAPATADYVAWLVEGGGEAEAWAALSPRRFERGAGLSARPESP